MLLLQILAIVIPLFSTIVIHEYAHGWVALKFGDTLARDMGRLTLNPIKHIDPFGTIVMPLVLGYLTNWQFPLGYAKPVPIDTSSFKNPQKDMALVALAGPMSNFFMAVGWSLLLIGIGAFFTSESPYVYQLVQMATLGIFFNLVIMSLNLLPIPPLDGGRVVMGVFPFSWARWLAKYELIGFVLLILLVIKYDLFNGVIIPMAQKFQMLIFRFLGI